MSAWRGALASTLERSIRHAPSLLVIGADVVASGVQRAAVASPSAGRDTGSLVSKTTKGSATTWSAPAPSSSTWQYVVANVDATFRIRS